MRPARSHAPAGRDRRAPLRCVSWAVFRGSPWIAIRTISASSSSRAMRAIGVIGTSPGVMTTCTARDIISSFGTQTVVIGVWRNISLTRAVRGASESRSDGDPAATGRRRPHYHDVPPDPSHVPQGAGQRTESFRGPGSCPADFTSSKWTLAVATRSSPDGNDLDVVES